MTARGPEPAAEPDLLVDPAGSPPRPGRTRSHLPDGRVVQWRPPAGARAAVDAEPAAAPVPLALARRTGVRDPAAFWPRWTAVEAACKVRDLPVLPWLAAHGLTPPPGVRLQTRRVADLVVTLATAPGHGSGTGPSATSTSSVAAIRSPARAAR